ncbi:MAG: ATP-binding protein [Casimicrobiaceae bacterium]
MHGSMVDRLPVGALRYAATSAAYVSAYVALDWVSYIHPLAQLAITPWNPPPGLSLFLLLRYGLRFTPALYVAAYLADVFVRGAPPNSLLAFSTSFLLASGYAAAGALLVGRFSLGRRLRDLRDVNCLVATAVLAPFLVGSAFVGLNVLLGGLLAEDFVNALLQFWIGDAIGIVVTTPLLLEFAENRLSMRQRVDSELMLQAGAVLLALWIVFGLEATDEFKFFYLLLLPLIWISMRRGLRGAVAVSLVMQLGLIVAVDNFAAKGIRLWELQLLMLTLALTALYLGMAVTERERARRTVEARDAALNRALRMATAGELAATVAHELNQPLSAIGTYAGACVSIIDRQPPIPLLRDTLKKVTREVDRAGDVIRRLRDFYRNGSTRRERATLGALIDIVMESSAPGIAGNKITVTVDYGLHQPAIEIDTVQMQMVMHNLLTNAAEALSMSTAPGRWIRMRLMTQSEGMLTFEIADNGPGISADVAGRLFEPFTSTKIDGMGLGLAMSRSIVEAHGGTLTLKDAANPGATFQITLPIAKNHERDNRN